MKTVATIIATLVLSATPLLAQTTAATATQPAAAGVVTGDPTQAIDLLRHELVDAFNKGDLDRMLAHLDPDCVVTWQNAEVCRGPEAVRAYYNKMMMGPERRVEKVVSDPKVDDRHVYGDWAVSWGNMNDHFTLVGGQELAFNSRFTATIARRGEAWKVTSFHVSVNAFDNPILSMIAKKTAIWSLFFGVIIGGVIGLIIGIMRKRQAVRVAPPPVI
jgi:ketosteroid isomerase-like protein